MCDNESNFGSFQDRPVVGKRLAIDSVLVNNKSISFGQSKALNPCFVGGTITNEAQLAANVVVIGVFFYFVACLVLFQAPFPCQ